MRMRTLRKRRDDETKRQHDTVQLTAVRTAQVARVPPCPCISSHPASEPVPASWRRSSSHAKPTPFQPWREVQGCRHFQVVPTLTTSTPPKKNLHSPTISRSSIHFIPSWASKLVFQASMYLGAQTLLNEQ